MTKQICSSIARAKGLDRDPIHLEELHRYLESVLPGLKRVEELEFTDLEPTLPPRSREEGQR